MSTGSLKSRLLSVLEPVALAEGCDVEDVQVTPAGNRRLVRVLVDTDGGITLDDVATLSRAISEALDSSDVMGAAPYVLEVSSPGVDHPLSLPRHWRRATGRLVTATVAGAGTLTARVVSADDEAVTFAQVDGTEVTHPLASLGRGKVQVEFSRPGAHHDEDTADEDTADEDTADEDTADEGGDATDDLGEQDDLDGADAADDPDETDETDETDQSDDDLTQEEAKA